MENKHFYWLKALRQKYSYQELITNLKIINQDLKLISKQCEYKIKVNPEILCKRMTKLVQEYQHCCNPEIKCRHNLCWQHQK